MPDYFYVYPQYLAGPSRALGRRIKKADAVKSGITKEEILVAAKALGFAAEAEDKHYSRSFWRYDGRIKVVKKEGTSKSKFLKMVATELAQAERAKE